MRRVLACVLGVGLCANGLTMLAGLLLWRGGIPGESRPLSALIHRDIGVAYGVAGVALIGYAIRRDGRAAARAGATFLVLHGQVHGGLRGAVHRRASAAWRGQAGRPPVDGTSPFLPPLLALWHKHNEGESDDHMVSATVDHQVRAQVEL